MVAAVTKRGARIFWDLLLSLILISIVSGPVFAEEEDKGPGIIIPVSGINTVAM